MKKIGLMCCMALVAMTTSARLNAAGTDACFEKAKFSDWGVRTDETNWKIFRRYNYVNFLLVFDDNISMIAHPKLPGIIEVTLNGKPLVRHQKYKVSYNIKLQDDGGENVPVENWFPEHGPVEVVIGHRNETGEENKFITNIRFDSSELVDVIAKAQKIRARLKQAHLDGTCTVDRFNRVIIVPG